MWGETASSTLLIFWPWLQMSVCFSVFSTCGCEEMSWLGFVWRFLQMLLQFGVKKVRTQIKNTREAVRIENKALFNTSWVTKVQIPKNTKENTKAKNKTTTRRSKKYNSGIKTRNMTRGNTVGHRWAQVKGGKTNDGRNWNATLDTRRHNFKIRQNHKLNQDKWLKSSAINLFFNKH